MNSPHPKSLLRLLGLLLTLGVASAPLSADAQILLDFKGTINSSTSSIFTVGQSLDFSLTTASSTPSQTTSVSLGGTVYTFTTVTDATLTIDGTSYDLGHISTGTESLPNGTPGIPSPIFGIDAISGTIDPNATEVGVRLESSSPSAIDANYFPLASLPLSSFDVASTLYVFDPTYTGAPSGPGQGIASIASYSLTYVPEPATWSALAGVAVLAGALIRRRTVFPIRSGH